MRHIKPIRKITSKTDRGEYQIETYGYQKQTSKRCGSFYVNIQKPSESRLGKGKDTPYISIFFPKGTSEYVPSYKSERLVIDLLVQLYGKAEVEKELGVKII